MSKAAIGTLEWARMTGGRLSGIERYTLLVSAMLARINAMLARRQQRPVDVDIENVRVPDTQLCVSACTFMSNVSPPWLANHNLRTFAWAKIIGIKDGINHDDEELFLACVLHDLGLCAAGAELCQQPAHCFAVEGAWAAYNWLTQQGAGQLSAESIAEAICLHLNVKVSPLMGAAAHLLHEGAMIDVIGTRLPEIGKSTCGAVTQRHPRLNMKHELCTSLKADANTRRHSRAGFLVRHGFLGMIQASPFDE